MQSEPKPYLTTDNPWNICERITATTLQLLWCSVVTISARSCIGYCMLFDTSRCDPFTDVPWLLTARCMLVVRYPGKLPYV